MDKIKIIVDEDDYSISLNEFNGRIKYQHYPNSAYMYFNWWDTSSVSKLLIRRLKTEPYCVVHVDSKLKKIPSHNNIYRDDALHFVHIAYPKIIEYLENNGYKNLRKKDFNRESLEKCNINYLVYLYSKVK